MTWRIRNFDPDAQAYISRVQQADGQSLEANVQLAINAFVVGCKSDGIWNAIKASCILAGARTLNGALQPLVGTAPTNFNFVAGDYDRKTGLLGNGSTKYLNSNRNNNADPQNSNHQAVWVSTAQQAVAVIAYMGAGSGSDPGATHIGNNKSVNELFFRSRGASPATASSASAATSLLGLSRASSANFTYRVLGVNTVANIVSQTPFNGNVLVFNRITTGGFTDARLAFYSVGEGLDLTLLDNRVSTLMTEIGAAIP